MDNHPESRAKHVRDVVWMNQSEAAFISQPLRPDEVCGGWAISSYFYCIDSWFYYFFQACRKKGPKTKAEKNDCQLMGIKFLSTFSKLILALKKALLYDCVS